MTVSYQFRKCSWSEHADIVKEHSGDMTVAIWCQKVILGLTTTCVILAFSHGFCFFAPHKPEIKNCKMLPPVGCTDPYDGNKHPFGSAWNTTTKCMFCTCTKDGLECCSRYGGVVKVQGCKAVVDPKTCKYKFYDIKDPTKPCGRKV